MVADAPGWAEGGAGRERALGAVTRIDRVAGYAAVPAGGA